MGNVFLVTNTTKWRCPN